VRVMQREAEGFESVIYRDTRDKEIAVLLHNTDRTCCMLSARSCRAAECSPRPWSMDKFDRSNTFNTRRR
jgi:hypothetical protein